MAHKSSKAPPPAPLGILRGHGAPVNAISFLAPTTIVSGAADGVVKIWDLKTRRERATFSQAHSKAGVLHTSALADDSTRFVTQGRDGFVKLWDASTFNDGCEPLLSYYCGSYSFTKFAVQRWPAADQSLENGNLIVSPSAESNQIFIYDVRSPATSRPSLQVAVPDGSSKKGMCMSLCLFESRSGNNGAAQTYIAAGYESGELAILELRSGGKLASEAQVTAGANPLLAFDVTQDGQSAICGSAGEDLYKAAFDASTFTISSESFFQCNHGGIGAIRIRGDQRIFATAGWDHRVRVFHLRKLKPLAILKYHTESVFGLDFSADSSMFVSASKDHKIALWSIYPPAFDQAVHQKLRTY
uniref:Anaphase-promoting complex subunit 4 WD40 domain-containing protein n=1 Tax=Globisporangium ultimum (strain ATCC 200006 / CBS 805.95 / DAOM BR144) TaxID=431595 RepID=K3WKA8_GLOUD